MPAGDGRSAETRAAGRPATASTADALAHRPFSRGSHLQLASSTVAVAWTTDGPAAPAGHGRCAGRLFNTGQMISKVAPRVTRPVQDDEQSPVPTVQRRTDSAPKSGSAQRLGVDLSTCSALFLGSGQDRQIQIQCLSRRATDV